MEPSPCSWNEVLPSGGTSVLLFQEELKPQPGTGVPLIKDFSFPFEYAAGDFFVSPFTPLATFGLPSLCDFHPFHEDSLPAPPFFPHRLTSTFPQQILFFPGLLGQCAAKRPLSQKEGPQQILPFAYPPSSVNSGFYAPRESLPPFFPANPRDRPVSFLASN